VITTRPDRTLAPLLALALGLAACGDEPGPSGSGGGGLEISIAPLAYPDLAFACFDLRIDNEAGQPVEVLGDATRWPTDRATVCSDRYGNGPLGDVKLVVPCDATDVDGDGVAENLVSLWIDGLYGPAIAGGPIADVGGWRNPCPHGDGPSGCALVAACSESGDTPVRFDLTIMRDGGQGFFDISVAFDDIFCSAKVDCVYDDGEAIMLVRHPTTLERLQTAVLAFTCTDGTNPEPTWLYMDDLVVDCGAGARFTLDAAAGPGPVVVTPAEAAGPVPAYHVIEGSQQVPGGGAVDLLFWNLALGLDLDWLAAEQRDCMLRTRATASAGPLEGATTPAAATYPYVDFVVPLWRDGALACAQHPLDGGRGVETTYTLFEPEGRGVVPMTFGNEASAVVPGGDAVETRDVTAP